MKTFDEWLQEQTLINGYLLTFKVESRQNFLMCLEIAYNGGILATATHLKQIRDENN